jgi:hypothetical protein
MAWLWLALMASWRISWQPSCSYRWQCSYSCGYPAGERQLAWQPAIKPAKPAKAVSEKPAGSGMAKTGQLSGSWQRGNWQQLAKISGESWHGKAWRKRRWRLKIISSSSVWQIAHVAAGMA